MPKYVTIDFFKTHSRIDATGEEEYLGQCIDAAEDTLARDLQVDDLKKLERADGTFPPALKQAILMLAGTSYENRETEGPAQMHADPHYWHLIRTYIKYR